MAKTSYNIRISGDAADRVMEIALKTHNTTGEVVQSLVEYAINHVVLKPMQIMGLHFDDEGREHNDTTDTGTEEAPA